MFSVVRKELDWGGRTLTLETGMIARQAHGAVLATYGGTQVLATVVAASTPREGVDFFPLSVHYQEKAFAGGKIPGGFFKREGRPGEKEVLVSRLIDRPIRPLFTKGFKNETQVVCTVLASDLENNPDIVAMVATGAALTLSGIPFQGPVCGVRVGYKDGAYLLNPRSTEESDLDLVVAGTDEGVLMVESEARELSEDVMLGAVMHGFESFQVVIEAIKAMQKECGKEVWAVPDSGESDSEVAALERRVGADLRAAYAITTKSERRAALEAVKGAVVESAEEESQALQALKTLEGNILRQGVLESGQRIDGRSTTDIRPIDCRVGVLNRTHGSALFTRGETQALVVTTLGTGQDEQIIDALEGEYREHFMLHYNFPSYSVGEVGRMMSPGRREIGHGKLAWRALHPLLPAKDDFPYTLRVVSEITESNGSSSMATVCGASMALMDAGVPLRSACAGIAMGLIKEGESFAILSDILGDEDHLGDMDFKVAGTHEGITALQMDIKITSITEAIMREALAQAKDGRMHILKSMEGAIQASRDNVSTFAPKVTSLTVPKEKIRDIIGTGGKVIREICEVTGTKVDIDDDGTVKVASSDDEASQRAVDWIQSIIAEPEAGKVYQGKVVKVMDFGAFVNFMGSRDGLVHISELAPMRVQQVSDVVKEGDEVRVLCLGADDRGKVRLSMKRVDQSTGEITGDFPARDGARRGGGRPRDGGPREGAREGGGRQGGFREGGQDFGRDGERRRKPPPRKPAY